MSHPIAAACLSICIATFAMLAPHPRSLGATQDGGFAKLSPFTAVRDVGGAYEVEYEGTWHRLVAIEGITAEDLRAHCVRHYRDRAEKRFAEDLVEVLAGLDREPGTAVDLVLERLDDGTRREIARAAMTEENRRKVWLARRDGDSPRAKRPPDRTPAPRIEREHDSTIDPRYAGLAAELADAAFPPSPEIGRDAAQRDLDQLEWRVKHAYSYRDLEGIDVDAAFDAVRSSLPQSQKIATFAARIARLLALFGDGHSRVRDLEAMLPAGCLPFLLADTRRGVVAFREDRSGFLDPQRPRLIAIDGRAIADWRDVAARYVAAGSPSFVAERGLRFLRMWNAIRVESGLAPASEIELVLAREDGTDEQTMRLPLSSRKPIHGDWPRDRGHRVIDHRAGYLRLAGMESDPGFVAGLHRAMEKMRGLERIVIDVRGNGGGSRDALLALLPYFLDGTLGPQIANVAAARLGCGDDDLENRFMYQAGDARWSAAQRAAIEEHARDFVPEFTLPRGEFSPWHYLVIDADAPFTYEGEVIVLLDGACFSATDIFLGAFADLTAATLVGVASGGGSGRALGFELEHSGLAVQLSSMASFRPDGELYDGRGVAPDVVVLPSASDLLEDGTDTVLDSALALAR
jgi:hypothetical protein